MDDNKINYYAIYFDDCLYDTGSYEYCQDCTVEIKKQCQDKQGTQMMFTITTPLSFETLPWHIKRLKKVNAFGYVKKTHYLCNAKQG